MHRRAESMNRRNWLRTATLLAALGVASASAQAPSAPPCRAPEFAQFDFWLGDWTVRWTDKEKGEQVGSNRIRKTLDGCVILEEFDGRPGTPLVGTSVSTFVPRAGKWKQTWVDNSGSYLDFEGELRDGRMVLSRRAPLRPAANGLLRHSRRFADLGLAGLEGQWRDLVDVMAAAVHAAPLVRRP